MMMNRPDPTGPIILSLIIFIIFYLFYVFGGLRGVGTTTTETYVETDEDNPELKFLSECRQACVNNMIAIISDILHVMPDDMTINIDSTDFNKNLINIYYENHLIRFYCNWVSKKIKVVYHTRTSYTNYQNQKTYAIKDGVIDLEAFNKDFAKWYIKGYKSLLPTDDERFISVIAGARAIESNPEIKDEDVVRMLLEAWDDLELRVDIDHLQADEEALVKVTTFLMRFYPEETIKYIQSFKKTDEPKNEETAEK